MPSNDDVEIQDREICHQGFFRLERLRLRHGRFDGGWTPTLVREVLVRGLAVAVLPYDPVRDEVVLIEQFRPGALVAGEPAWMIEIVAGIAEEDEDLEDVARREAMEEAGMTVGTLEPVARYMPSPGGSSETVQIYVGRVDAEGAAVQKLVTDALSLCRKAEAAESCTRGGWGPQRDLGMELHSCPHSQSQPTESLR